MSDNQFDFGPAAKQIESLKGAANGLASLDSSGLVPNSQLPSATQSAAGTMSAADKTKLDGIATGATANVVSDSLSDTSTTNALSAAKGKALNDSVTALNAQIATLRIKDITNATRTNATSTSSTTNIDQLYTVPADGWYRLVSHCPSNASAEAYCKAGTKQLIYAGANQRVEIVIPIKQGTKIYLTAIYGGESFIEQYTM